MASIYLCLVGGCITGGTSGIC